MWYLMICQVLLWTRLAWWRKILLFVLQYRFQLFVHSMNLVLHSFLPPVVAREVSVWSWRRKYKCWQVQTQSLQYLTICLFFRNMTDVFLHLIQPKFLSIFGEHYYRQGIPSWKKSSGHWKANNSTSTTRPKSYSEILLSNWLGQWYLNNNNIQCL